MKWEKSLKSQGKGGEKCNFHAFKRVLAFCLWHILANLGNKRHATFSKLGQNPQVVRKNCTRFSTSFPLDFYIFFGKCILKWDWIPYKKVIKCASNWVPKGRGALWPIWVNIKPIFKRIFQSKKTCNTYLWDFLLFQSMIAKFLSGALGRLVQSDAAQEDLLNVTVSFCIKLPMEEQFVLIWVNLLHFPKDRFFVRLSESKWN